MGFITIEVSNLEKIIDTEMKKVLTIISKDYNIDNTNLSNKVKNKYHLDVFLNYPDIIKEIKERKKRPIDPSNFCMARKPNLKRCTRAKKINCDYCPSHQFNILYGRIDEEPQLTAEKKTKILPSKPNKNKVIKDKNKITKNTIKLKTIVISEKEYYIDTNNHLYITEKEKDQIKYRHIGNWNKSNQTIEFREN